MDARPAGAKFVPVKGRTPRAFSDALGAVRPRESGLCDVLYSLERVARCDCYRAGDGVHRAWLERRESVGATGSIWSALQKAARRLNPKHRQLLRLEAELFKPDGSGARAVIANSRLVAGEITSRYSYPADRIRVIPNGLPADAFTLAAAGVRDATRRRLELADSDYAVLFAGSGWERKGLRFAMEAVAHLDPQHRAVLLVAGAGDQRIASAGASAADPRRVVRFLGPVPGTEMRALLAAADVFLLPTLYDPFSNACLEAFAAGLPVITTAHNGFAEALVPTQTGDVASRADAIPELVLALTRWADPERRLAARPGILAAAARYTIEANLAETLAFLTRLPPAPAGS